MKQFDAIVIGAGISGLSFASHAAAKGLNTLVLEKSDRPGGCFHSHRFQGSAAGFWLELGAHTCYNSYGGLLELMERHGLMGNILPREKVSFKLLVKNEVKSIPSQLSFPELACSAWKLFTQKKDGASVASYYGGIVGRRNYERVFGPAFNAVISQRADDFPADMLFNKRPRRKDVIKSFTLQGGLNSVIDKLAVADRVTLQTGAEVTRIAKDGDGYTVELADGTVYQAPRLTLAAPPPASAQLAAQIAPELAKVLTQIKLETIESVGVAVQKSKLKLPLIAGLIPIGEEFYSAVSRDTVLHDSYRGFSFHYKAGKVSLEAKLKRIASVLQVQEGDLEQVVQRESQLPSPVVGHKALTDQIDRLVAGSNLYVTGNYFAGMAVEDCIVRSKKEFERLSASL
ncbi:protoporphyrinogen/coproporphyrinogen oxidase [Geomonas propionica]|uniref:FAD-dependent oxidoreductase n=1 Tax=Geomonas propionica TaxID=2798582 RepID=A0ABS0YM33_9BACT|nr:FAD-dependent oxidoreductase [Geomonas propionica]MBJ6798940.1 FAD-dependent oxidoreductase [Geomonas propionica]